MPRAPGTCEALFIEFSGGYGLPECRAGSTLAFVSTTASDFVAAYESRGWTQKALAQRWGIHRTRLWQIAQDPARPSYWDDALRGLPMLARKLPKKRAGRPRGQVRRLPRGLRYASVLSVGTVVMVDHHLGDIDEGVPGLVIGTRRPAASEEHYWIVFETGHALWLTPDDLDRYVVSTGMERKELLGYRPTSEAQIEADRRRGLFQFR
jgi:hypothetical protein